MTAGARAYIAAVVLIGTAVLTTGLNGWEGLNWFRFLTIGMIACVAAGLKVSLPGVTGTMSVNFLFVLLAIAEFGLGPALAIGCIGALIQCFWRAKKQPRIVQVLFNTASMATAIMAAHLAFRGMEALAAELIVPLLTAAGVFFLGNTLPVAIVISLTESKSLRKVWSECYFWAFPYYILGAGIAALICVSSDYVGWPASLLILPVTYLIYRSYHFYLARLEAEKDHANEMASLHLRTIEALALAIEAKDDTTHDHLQRVQVYVMAIAPELGLSEEEVEALRAAAVLHDIGKLGVPEHIISKPGRLTPEEFEKVKVHPVVGAEILEQVQFPYPVAPIVRYHHEKWNGSGYPEGLRGEQIPIGARILAPVDCLDAMASDRQYRPAVPLEQAMEAVVSEAGKSFDPKVVEILQRRYVELEEKARAELLAEPRLSKNVRVTRGASPAAGFEGTSPSPGPRVENRELEFLSSIASARQEAQTLFELTQHLGTSLSLEETLSVLSTRLKRLIAHHCCAVYVLREDKLVPAHVSGEDFQTFASLEIPMGEGLSGWVAAQRKPILNGNPSVEPGYLGDPSKFSVMRSALNVPLEGLQGIVGTLALYHRASNAFTADHLRILLAVSSKVGLSIENALRFQQVETSATTDYLTGLPNARSLFMQLDGELKACQRRGDTLAVLVGDVDGFKQVNDRFGHLKGNEVLQAVARKLRDNCREYDSVARMGGDEFVILVPGLKPQAVHKRIQGIRLEVEDLFPREPISMSVGVAFYPADGENAEQLLAAADRDMYKQKASHKPHNPKDRALLVRDSNHVTVH